MAIQKSLGKLPLDYRVSLFGSISGGGAA